MRKICKNEAKEGLPSLPNKNIFRVTDDADVELLPTVANKLHCSLATIYRTLERAEIPLYHLPNRRGTVFLQSASLWRLAKTAAFAKYYKRLNLSDEKEASLEKSTDKGMTIAKAVECGLLALTLDQAIKAARCGLVPNTNQVLEPWFVKVLEGKTECFLPCKKRN